MVHNPSTLHSFAMASAFGNRVWKGGCIVESCKPYQVSFNRTSNISFNKYLAAGICHSRSFYCLIIARMKTAGDSFESLQFQPRHSSASRHPNVLIFPSSDLAILTFRNKDIVVIFLTFHPAIWFPGSLPIWLAQDSTEVTSTFRPCTETI